MSGLHCTATPVGIRSAAYPDRCGRGHTKACPPGLAPKMSNRVPPADVTDDGTFLTDQNAPYARFDGIRPASRRQGAAVELSSGTRRMTNSGRPSSRKEAVNEPLGGMSNTAPSVVT